MFPASFWPLDVQAQGTARQADSELVPPTVGASTPETPGIPSLGNSSVACAGPVVVEAQATSPVIELPCPPSADVTTYTEPAQPPPTPPVLAAAAVAQRPSVAHPPWHPAVAVIEAEPVQSQSPAGERPGVQATGPRSPFFGPKASPRRWLEAPPQQPLPRADSPLRSPTQPQRATGALTPGGMIPGDSTPGGMEFPAFRTEVLLSITDIPAFSHPPFGIAQAHERLNKIRLECARRQLHCIDLTTGSEMPWRSYICSHPQASEIIDVGLIRFVGQFMNEVEPDWETLGLPSPFGSHRFYFVACRANGTACRLHPSTTCYVAPGVGLLANWFWLPPLETLPEENRGLYSSCMVYNPSRSLDEPALVRLECVWLHHEFVAGGHRRDIRISVRVHPPDRDSSMFPWHSFLSRWAYGKCLLREGVTSFTLTSDEAGPAIEVTTHEHPAPRVITFRNGWSHLLRE